MSAAPMMDLDHDGNGHASPATPDAAFSFTLAKSYLAEALGRVVGLASAGKLPIAQSVLVESHADHLALSTTNFDQWITTTLPGVTASASGVVALPAKRLQEIVNALPAGVVTIAIKAKRAKITAGRARFELVGLSADEWPASPTFVQSFGLSVVAKDFQSALDRAAAHLSVTSESSSNALLQGVCLASDAEGVVVVGSDGKTSALLALSSDPALVPFSVIVPDLALPSVKRLTGGAEMVTITAGEQYARFSTDRTTLTSRLVNGDYPVAALRRFGRASIAMTVTVDRAELIAATERVRLVCNSVGEKHMKAIELGFAADGIRIRASENDVGESEDRVPATRVVHEAGTARRMGFNADYLVACLKSLTADRVVLGLAGAERPVIFRDDAPETADRVIGMPIRMPLERPNDPWTAEDAADA